MEANNYEILNLASKAFDLQKIYRRDETFNQCTTLLRDALSLRFGGGPETWHFLRVTKRNDLLKTFVSS